jgi:hypothetical protein
MKKEICERISKEKEKFFVGSKDVDKSVRRLSIEVFLDLGWKNYQESFHKINGNYLTNETFLGEDEITMFYQYYHGLKLIDFALKKIKEDKYENYESEFQNFPAIDIKNFGILRKLESWLDEYSIDENPAVLSVMHRTVDMSQQTTFIEENTFISQFDELTEFEDDDDKVKCRNIVNCFCVIV